MATSSSNPYQELRPSELWRHFFELNQLPRASGREELARLYAQSVAEREGATWRVDRAGNLVVCVPARGGHLEAAPPVAIQCHLDMVCEKDDKIDHDFDRDPIRPVLKGDRISANGTTLGADNGIGVAAALSLLTTRNVNHGRLELVFTVREETGLQGALALDTSLLSARLLLNLDSEQPDQIVVGSAGGDGATIIVPLRTTPVSDGACVRRLRVRGLKGGHSGLQIHEPRANALRLVSSILTSVQRQGIEFACASLAGGRASNAIPREAEACLVLACNAVAAFDSAVAGATSDLHLFWSESEPGLRIESECDIKQDFSSMWSVESTENVIRLLAELPHGVLAMSSDFPGKVQTSANLASIESDANHVRIVLSTRSFLQADLESVATQIRNISKSANATVEISYGYPAWYPDPNSSLAKLATRLYRKLHGQPPRIDVLHGGLECGVIVSKIRGMEAVSFGPLIEGAHTTNECVYASTVTEMWELLVALLNEIGDCRRTGRKTAMST